MSGASVERVARALRYEGYMLYPYRRSAVKNRQRFNFGVIYPEAHSRAQQGADPWEMQTECLLEAGGGAGLEVTVRFLHLFARAPEQPGVPEWHEAIEREVTVRVAALGELLAIPRSQPFSFPAADHPGRQLGLEGRLDLGADPAAEGVFRVRVAVANLTPSDPDSLRVRDEIMLRSLISAHTILRAVGGEFVSMIDPPAGLKASAEACRNLGTWPVLAGENGARDTMLSSPIIIYDFPTIAPESPGDFFDGTEMDEMLTLRILTMTDEEKREMAATDERARLLLERTEASSPEELMRMHGVLRDIRRLGEAS
jgi:hypothetical protein